jgi:hypothetical protein
MSSTERGHHVTRTTRSTVAAGIFMVLVSCGSPATSGPSADETSPSSAPASTTPSASPSPHPIPPITDAPGLLAVSRDGDIVVRQADGSGLRQLTHNRNVAMYPITWTSDGRRLIVETHSTLDPNAPAALGLLELESSAYKEVGLISGTPSWSPDGTKVAFGGNEGSGIIVVDLTDGSYRQLTDEGRGGPDCCHGPFWSPDGELIAYQGYDGVSSEVFVVRVADGTVTSPVPNEADDFPLRWAGAGGTLKIIFESQRGTDGTKFSGRPWVVNLDGSGLELLTDSSLEDRVTGYAPITVRSPDGLWLATDCEAGVCVASAADPGGMYPLPRTQGRNTAEVRPSWVSGGNYVVFGMGGGDYREVVVAMPLPEGEPITITPEDVSESFPAWQPVPQE